MIPRKKADSSELPFSEKETEYQDIVADTPSTSPLSASTARFSLLHTQSKPSPSSSFHSTTSFTSSFQSPENSLEKIKDPSLFDHDSNYFQETKENVQAEEEDEFEQYAYETRMKPYPAPFYKRSRFWWICSGITAVFLIIFIPILIKFIIPAVAQWMMNSSEMVLLQMNMTEPSDTRFGVSVDAKVDGIPTLFGAKIEFAGPVQVFWLKDEERGGGEQQRQEIRVGQMVLGTIDKKAGEEARFLQKTIFEIGDSAQFGALATVMMAADTFLWRMTTQVTITVLGQTIPNLTLDKTLVLKGLNNFSGLKILAFDIPSDAPNGAGAMVSIVASIDNPSPIGLSLGTMTLDMGLETAYLGRVIARNVLLVGGQPTILRLEGMIQKQTEPQALQELSAMISNYLANTPTKAYGKGVSVLPDGVREVSWITKAIVGTRLEIPLLPPEPLKMVKAVTIKNLDLIMDPRQPWVPMASSLSIGASFQLPFNLTMTITQIWDAFLSLGSQGQRIADITAAVFNATQSDLPNKFISFTLPSSPLPIREDAQEAFGKFMVDVCQKEHASIEIQGRAQSTAVTSVGNVSIRVPFNTTVGLDGINFGKLVPEFQSIVVASANVNQVNINATVIIHNPSIFKVEAGEVTLRIKSAMDGIPPEYVGDVYIPNLLLAPGPNALKAVVQFKPKNEAFRDRFFADYIVGKNIAATMYGDRQSSSIVSLGPIMESLTLSTHVPGMNPIPRMVLNGNGQTSIGQFMGRHEIQVQIQLLNPLATSLWVQELTADVSWKGFLFGSIAIKTSFMIRPNGPDYTPVLAIQIPANYQFWRFMITNFIPQNLGVLTGASVLVDIKAVITATVDGPMGVGYLAKIAYSQDQVDFKLKIEFDLTGIFGKRRLKRRSWVGRVEVEEEVAMEDALGPTPSKDSTEEYLQWLKRAVDLSYPEEAALDTLS